MNIKKILITVISAGKPHLAVSPGLIDGLRYCMHWVIFAFLYGLSWGYRGSVSLRLWLYRKQILKQTILPCPVISVGNITTGGTGKTPMVMLVADLLRQQGKRVVILSRGYRRKTGENKDFPHIVQVDDDVHVVGDEPLLMNQSLSQSQQPGQSDVTVIVDRKRARAGQFAIEHFKPDVILLDDGFQHLPLARTCDLVLIDATQPFGGGDMLPAGFLREPLSQLRRAHAFVITHSNDVADLTPIRQQIHAINPAAPIFTATIEFAGLRQVATGETVALDSLSGKRFLSVCGLGNPASFQRVLKNIGLNITYALDFPDHHWYTAADAATIQQAIQKHTINAIVTTAKDEVKLRPFCTSFSAPSYTVTVALRIQPAEEFAVFIRHVSGEKKTR